MDYRRDIDGLRTVAVLPVVFYHAGYSAVTGGFVGVDVFFVISGFLITGLIANLFEQDRWSFVEFYVRRIKRLFPALVGVGIFAFWLAWTYFIPQDFSQFIDSLVGMLTFVSNFVFLAQADYFAEAATTKPLLHTWSLAVEEQFYLILPFLLILLLKKGGRDLALSVLSFACVISFVLAVYFMESGASNHAFFNSGLRFWELLAGSILALTQFRIKSAVLSKSARLAGMILILFAVVFYSHSTDFPGLSAFIPVIGTVLILAGSPAGGDLILKLLETKVFVYIGKLSYSLYLWHWPLLVASKFVAPEFQYSTEIAIGLSFVAAALSYHFIETPFRFGKILNTPVKAFASLILISGVSLSGAGYLKVTDAASNRFEDDKAVLVELLDTNRAKKYWRWENKECSDRIKTLPKNRPSCLTIGDPEKETVLLLGDSHAQHLLHGIRTRWSNANVIGIMAGSCKPFRNWDQSREDCDLLTDYLFKDFDLWSKVDVVVVAFRFREEMEPHLMDTIDWLSKTGKFKIVYVGSVPEHNPPFDDVVSANPTKSLDDIASIARRGRLEELDGPIKAARKRIPRSVKYVNAKKILCGRGTCKFFTKEKLPIVLDYGHFTPEGSVWFVKKWPDIFE